MFRKGYQTRKARYSDIDWKESRARAERVDRIIRESKVKRQDIARQVGLTSSELSLRLTTKTVPLGPGMQSRIEQAVDLLLYRNWQRWEENRVRAERVDRIIRESRLQRQEIARQVGLTPSELSLRLTTKTVPLAPEIQARIEQAVDVLLHRIRERTKNRAHSKADPDNAARAARLNRIIRESKLKRHVIAKQAGITSFHLSRVLRSMSTPLSPDLEQRIEQAVDDLLRQARSKTDRTRSGGPAPQPGPSNRKL